MSDQRLRVPGTPTEWAARINAAWQKMVSNIIETGQTLIDAKADLPHGAFTAMIEDDLAFGPRTAERLMAIASHPTLSNPTHASVLPASWMTLAQLARLDGARVETLIRDGQIYPKLERKDAALLLPPPKPKATDKKVKPQRADSEPATKTHHVDPAPKVVDAKVIEEAPPETETEYRMIRQDATPPIAHVKNSSLRADRATSQGKRAALDPAPSDNPRVVFLQDELAASNEEIEQLKSAVSGFITIVEEKDREIVGLQARYAALEARLRLNWTERLERAFLWLWEHGRPANSDDAQTLEERVALIELEYAAALPIAEESAPASESIPASWNEFVNTYRASDAPLPDDDPKLLAGMVRWADDHGFDIEQLDGAPEEARHLWMLTAKNFCGQSVARNRYREISAAILKRYGSSPRERRGDGHRSEMPPERRHRRPGRDVPVRFRWPAHAREGWPRCVLDDPPRPGQGGCGMSGTFKQIPLGPDLKQTVLRSPFACARRRREKSIRFQKLVAMSLAWQKAKGAENPAPDHFRG